MKFEKIIIPPGWQESFTKYPNGKTIFEALSHTITTVNEGIEEVNQKVNQGLLAIDQAENTIRQEITESFNTLKLQLEDEVDGISSDLIADFALLQSDVLTLISGKANAADVYTKQQVDAQLAEIEQDKAEKTDIGLLSGLLTTAKISIVNAINELFNNKANKAQEAWITPTLLNGVTSVAGRPFAYRKNQFNRLEFKGNLTGLTISPFMTLPATHNPITAKNAIVNEFNLTTIRIVYFDYNGNATGVNRSVRMLSADASKEVCFDGVSIPLD